MAKLRMDQLIGHEPPPKVVLYNFALTQRADAGNILRQRAAPDITLRPHRIFTNVERRKQVHLDALFIDGTNQLTQSIDAYFWCSNYRDEIQAAFMKEHGLKTVEEMYDYCDRRDMDVPNNPRLELPTLRASRIIELVGRFLDVEPMFTFVFQFMGAVAERDLLKLDAAKDAK